MVFLWFSYSFPMVFLWFSYGFPMVFPMVFLWFSYSFPMVFLWFSYGFPYGLNGSRPETHIINYVGTCLIRAARLENAASRLAGDWMAIGHADIHGMLDLL